MRLRIVALIVTGLLLFAAVAAADNSFLGFQIVRVVLNGEEVESDVPAILVNGRTMLPLRKLVELTGLQIDRWDDETRTVYVSGGAAQAVATVNGEAITQQALYDRLVGEAGARVIDDLIQELLVEQAARDAGITVTEAEIDQAVAEISRQVGGDERLRALMSTYGISMEQLRADQAFRLKLTKLVKPTIAVDDAALERFFEENRGYFDQRTVRARHILLETREEALALLERLEAGADFAELAIEKSIDPSARHNGGDLGFFGVGMMVAEFEQVAFSLAAGELSEPFESPYGWHIVEVLEQRGTAPDFAAIKEEIRELYVEQQVTDRSVELMAELRLKAQIRNLLERR